MDRHDSIDNLPKINNIYKPVLNIDLFEMLGDEGKVLLLKAVEYRHDCVHRNGYNKDAKRLEVFTKEYVTQVGNVLEDLVRKIGGKLFNQAAF